MLQPRAAVRLVFAPALSLVAVSCMADVADGDTVGAAQEALQPGPCARACQAAASGACDWADDCEGDTWPKGAFCGSSPPRLISCDAALKAFTEKKNGWGVEYCYRECEGLK